MPGAGVITRGRCAVVTSRATGEQPEVPVGLRLGRFFTYDRGRPERALFEIGRANGWPRTGTTQEFDGREALRDAASVQREAGLRTGQPVRQGADRCPAPTKHGGVRQRYGRSRSQLPMRRLKTCVRAFVAARWPEQETVADQSQGVQLASIRAVARYWATDYDWRKCEAKLNSFRSS
jgi:hypothetical protein